MGNEDKKPSSARKRYVRTIAQLTARVAERTRRIAELEAALAIIVRRWHEYGGWNMDQLIDRADAVLQKRKAS
jgi:hypothetical protein